MCSEAMSNVVSSKWPAVYRVAIAKAYLRPEMIVAQIGASESLTAALTPLVKQVCILDEVMPLPLNEGSVDGVFADMYLHRCPNAPAVIGEMVRVLRRGGRLMMMVRPAADKQPNLTGEQMRAWLRAAGLVNIITDWIDDEDGWSVLMATGSKRVTGARDAVQTSYGALAASESCCAPQSADSCCSTVPLDAIQFETGYTPEQLQAIPATAAGFSLGCGNPFGMAGLRPGEVVLDIGSGGGIDALYAAQRVGPGGRVIGLDMTPAMIERARQAAAEAGLPQVEFRLGQAEAMPVEDESIDVILSNCVINLCEDKGRVFEEAYRVLKKGGRLSISDMVSDGPLPVSLRGDPTQWAGCVHGALPEQEYLDLIAQAGFRELVTARGASGGVIEGVQVYSLAVSARKL